MSVQHQGVDVPPPARSAKLKIICKLKMSKTPDLDSFFLLIKGRAFLCYSMNSGYSQGGKGGGGKCPPPQMKPCSIVALLGDKLMLT